MDDGGGAVVQEADGAGQVHDPAHGQRDGRRPGDRVPAGVLGHGLEAVLEGAARHELADDDEGLVAHGAGAEEEDQVGVAEVAGGGGGGGGLVSCGWFDALVWVLVSRTPRCC